MAQEIKKSESSTPPARYSDPFSAMRSEMDRVFDSFLGRGFGGLPSVFRGGGTSSVIPSIDARETATEFVVEADGVLSLKGEKKSEREEKKDDYHRTERSYGSFQRSFRVDDTVDPDKVKAAFEKGVLTVTLPKRPEAAKAQTRIPIGKG